MIFLGRISWNKRTLDVQKWRKRTQKNSCLLLNFQRNFYQILETSNSLQKEAINQKLKFLRNFLIYLKSSAVTMRNSCHVKSQVPIPHITQDAKFNKHHKRRQKKPFFINTKFMKYFHFWMASLSVLLVETKTIKMRRLSFFPRLNKNVCKDSGIGDLLWTRMLICYGKCVGRDYYEWEHLQNLQRKVPKNFDSVSFNETNHLSIDFIFSQFWFRISINIFE